MGSTLDSSTILNKNYIQYVPPKQQRSPCKQKKGFPSHNQGSCLPSRGFSVAPRLLSALCIKKTQFVFLIPFS